MRCSPGRRYRTRSFPHPLKLTRTTTCPTQIHPTRSTNYPNSLLHEFTIRAAGYSSDWMVDACDTRDVTIDSLGLRVGERFTWRYDFLAGWVIDLRVEAVTGDELATIRCVSGRRAGPPEWCGGPAGFQAWEDSHSLLEFLECIGELRDGVDAYGAPVDPDYLEDRLVALARWVGRVRFGKAVVDRRLTVLEVRPCVSLSRSG